MLLQHQLMKICIYINLPLAIGGKVDLIISRFVIAERPMRRQSHLAKYFYTKR